MQKRVLSRMLSFYTNGMDSSLLYAGPGVLGSVRSMLLEHLHRFPFFKGGDIRWYSVLMKKMGMLWTWSLIYSRVLFFLFDGLVKSLCLFSV